MRNFHSFLFAVCALALHAPDKGGGSGGAKVKSDNVADGAVSMPPGAELISEPINPAEPGTAEQHVANPNEEAKLTYRANFKDGQPLEINERPARLAGNIDHVGGFGGETAQDRHEAAQERAKAAAKAEKADK